MSKVGKRIANPISGESFVFLQTAAETNGEAFQFEWTLKPDGVMPFAHRHMRQTETFEVIAGQLTVTINDRDVVVQPGETIVVPKGAVHQPRCTSLEPLVARVTFHPALHVETALETICGLASDGIADKKGQPPFLRLAVMTSANPGENYLASMPIPIQKVALTIGALIGRMLGYQAVYPQYSNT